MNKDNAIVVELTNKEWMRIDVIASHTLRIRMSDMNRFVESPLVRYGMVQIPPCFNEYSVENLADSIKIRTELLVLNIHCSDGKLSISDASGSSLIRTTVMPRSSGSTGFNLEIPLVEGEAFYGMGNIHSERLQRRGLKTSIWAADTLHSDAPIPYLMSSSGWAVLMNTTWAHMFDIGNTNPDQMQISGSAGELDFFLFVGDNYAQLLDRYTDVAGKPRLLPIWAYGLNYCCQKELDSREVLDEAIKFRRSGTPCDLIGLDFGITESEYGHSTDIQWYPERFPTAEDKRFSHVPFLAVLQRHGFKLSLTLSWDRDLTALEERGLSPLIESYPQDILWDEHMSKFVDNGISAFIAIVKFPTFAHRQLRVANGMNDQELHNLYPVLLGKQLHSGFRAQTGKRPMIHMVTGFTGMQRYVATTSGKYTDHKQAVTSTLNYGLSGHAHTSSNMNPITREDIHYGFLVAWARINSQNHYRHPYLLENPLWDLFKKYAVLRYRLLPYLYTMAHVASRTGMPIMRAMPLMFPDDPNCRELQQQYMLGDAFLVVAFTTRIYLPQGIWIDYWSGERHHGPKTFEYPIPDDTGGPLFVRAGSILPLWPALDYVGQSVIHTITLQIYPYKHSEFTIIEDDGLTFQYEDGRMAVTQIKCEETTSGVLIQIPRRSGTYDGMPVQRSYELVVHTSYKPSSIKVNNRSYKERRRLTNPSAPESWRYDRLRGIVQLHVEEANASDELMQIEVLPPVGRTEKPNNSSHPLSVVVSVTPTFEEADSVFATALETGSAPIIDLALRTWWNAGLTEASPTHSWRLHLMNGCALIVRYIERRSWSANEVLGNKMDNILMLQEISTPVQGYQLLKRSVEQLLRYARPTQSLIVHPVIRDVLAIIEQEVAQEDLSLKKLAEQVAVHPFHLSRLFKKETGLTYSDYLLNKRMQRAKRLLELGMKVYEVSERVGFNDRGCFSKAFSKYWGAPPKSFKKLRIGPF